MKDEALRLADEIAEMLPKHVTEPVAAELRRLHAENQRCRNVCDATSEGWRADAEEWKAQRDALVDAEPVAVHQFRKRGCIDWFDGHPDHTDGGGPYVSRTLYLDPPQRPAEPVQEPVAWALSHSRGIEFSSRYPMQESRDAAEQLARQHMGAVTVTPLYAAPPQRKPPATIDEMFDRMNRAPRGVFYGHDPMTIWMEAWRAAEQHHGIKE